MSDNQQTSKINFEEVLDITMVFQYHEQLNQLLNEKKKICLNAENIERVDGAGLQLIVAFILSAEKLNLQISWSGVSQAFKDSAKILGVTENLKL
ncbi:MAG: STAS domain-containing protein [Pseudomonadota bacterium]